MTEKKEVNHKDNVIGLAIFMVIAFFLARSNFYSFEGTGFFMSFFTTNSVYQSGENIGGPVGALVFIRSTLLVIFLSLLWHAYSAKKKTSTYFLFYALVGFVVAKIGLDFFVFGKILNARGDLSILKTIIMVFIMLCIYQGVKNIEFKEIE